MAQPVVTTLDIVEEVDLSRILLAQGHLETAQRVLVGVCQANDQCIDAFVLLADLLKRKGELARAQALLEYVEELEVSTGQLPKMGKEDTSDAITSPVALHAALSPTILNKKDEARGGASSPPKVPAQVDAGAAPDATLPIPGENSSNPEVGKNLSLALASASATVPPAAPVVPSVVEVNPPSLNDAVTPGPSLSLPPVKAIEALPSSAERSEPTLPGDSFSGVPATRDSMQPASYPVRAPSSPELGKRSSRKRDTVILLLAAGAVAAAAAIAALPYFGKGEGIPVATATEELNQALSSGSLERLLRGRDRARILQSTQDPDLDVWARIGLVNAVLVRDYAVDAQKDAEDALDHVGSALSPGKEREVIIAVARGLLSLAAGDRAKAKARSDTALELLSDDSSSQSKSLALLLSSRIRALAGDVNGALEILDRAVSAAPQDGLVVVDWALNRLDAGDPMSARQVLYELLQKHAENSRARLLLAEAERALGDPGFAKNIELACQMDAKVSKTVRAACAIASAEQARLKGERGVAIQTIKATVPQTEDSQLLGKAALLLASLGEIDAAESALLRARKYADSAAPALTWPELAIRLGRGEAIEWQPFMAQPSGPERVYTAMRAAYLRKGALGVAGVLKALPPGILDLDGDLWAMSLLAQEEALSDGVTAQLLSRADQGNPVANYVLGLVHTKKKDHRGAVRRLEKALVHHGDACRASNLYLSEAAVLRLPGTQKAALRALFASNAKCLTNAALSSTSY